MTHTSFCHLDSDGRLLSERDSDRVYYAASTLKLGVAVAVLQRVDCGELLLTTVLPSQHRFASAVTGAPDFGFPAGEVDEGFPAQNTPVSLGECLERMIEWSSNEGTNMLAELVGLSAVNGALQQLGGRNSRMGRLICDYSARNAGLTIETTARDLAVMLHAILTARVLTPESTSLLLMHLRKQRFPFIVSHEGTLAGMHLADWGSKSGWVTGMRHDVAWFIRPGREQAEVLAVCTEGATTSEAWVREWAESIITAGITR
ncbi:serine hydrolase [Leucobacter coleopterorum]|uniref:Serine hydrolase n=1 Tax=Leucobacter coleopterorum TaxID=2714933 RepID=A0ABX6K1W1_9MICO|nr:serine hydrolase [Leucobacter coleopterorum]QIM19025.1 serine hydrolase [Leucobacter coleopterorum]